MVKFDPDTSREMLLGPVGIRYYLSADFDSLRTDRALGGSADGALLKAIECVLVAFDEPAVWLLEKAKGWLEAAIAMDERPNRYDRNFTEAQRHEDVAQCNWLLTGVHDAENHRRAIAFQDSYRGDTAWDEQDIDCCLADYYEAREHARVCEIFEGVPGIARPDLPDVKGEGSMAYVMCLHQLGRGYSDAEVQSATERFLKRSVPGWLDRGQFPTVARWMKLAYWRGEESRQAAWQSLLRCYDFLPGVNRPEST